MLFFIGDLAGTSLLTVLPENILNAFDYLLPALFGALFIQFAMAIPKLAPVALRLGLGLGFTYMVKKGFFPFYVTTLVCLFGTMFLGVTLYKAGGKKA